MHFQMFQMLQPHQVNFEYWNEFPAGAKVAAGGVYVIAHPQADASILAKADHEFRYLSNGDDGFKLV